MKSRNILELQSLTKTYGNQVLAVDGINLTIAEGVFLSLLGPSGCGKTTTLRMISGFEQPTSGQILFFGEDISKIPPSQRPFNLVFQNLALFPHMTVFDNVAYGLKYDGISKSEIRNRVSEMLTFMELLKYRESRIGYLSGGEQQRVALARALVKKPKCLLLDEPLASLDRKIRKQMEIELMRYHSEFGITFIYVTHNQDTAMAISEEMAIMNRGAIEQIGRPIDVYNNPANLFVGDFLGDLISMHGVVISVYDSHAVVGLKKMPLRLRVPARKGIEKGNEVVVALRPENVIMSSKEIRKENSIQAKVMVATFQGNFVKYGIRIENSELTVISNTVFRENQTVFIRFPNDKLLLFPHHN